jgi:hypothetical protein
LSDFLCLNWLRIFDVQVPKHVWLEGDAKVVVDAVNARAPVWTRWGHLVEDISLTLQNMSCWKMCFIRRAANQAAHAMARMAVKQEMERVWFNDAPNCLLPIIVSEFLAQGTYGN